MQSVQQNGAGPLSTRIECICTSSGVRSRPRANHGETYDKKSQRRLLQGDGRGVA